MKQAVRDLLAQKGYSPVFATIERTIRDFKQLQYTRAEIKESLFDYFGNEDQKIVDYINQSL